MEHELESAGQVDKFVIKEPPSQSAVVSSMSKQAITDSAITPICPTLATGSLYTLSNSQAGENVCYHFEITTRSKTTALLVGQSTDTNVNLSILRHNPDDTFTTIGSSANAGNQDEAVIALTEPGHYYWFMEVIESDGSPYNFGAAVATNLDAYEFNDTVATSTILPDRQNKIVGNMDSINDVDYYEFTAVRGQDVLLKFEDQLLDEWRIEVDRGGWSPISANTEFSISNLQPNQNVKVRISPNYNLPVNPSNNYTLTLGSKVTSTTDSSVSGESNVIRVPYSAFEEYRYATTQAYKKVSWAITLRDSTGHPVEGALAKFRIDQDVSDLVIDYVDFEGVSNSSGRASGVVDLGSCFSDIYFTHVDYSLGYKNTWKTDLLYGVWRIEIPNTGGLELGIGGDNVEYVTLGHLCDQDLISSNPS